jgi:hypothetical protein
LVADNIVVVFHVHYAVVVDYIVAVVVVVLVAGYFVVVYLVHNAVVVDYIVAVVVVSVAGNIAVAFLVHNADNFLVDYIVAVAAVVVVVLVVDNIVVVFHVRNAAVGNFLVDYIVAVVVVVVVVFRNFHFLFSMSIVVAETLLMDVRTEEIWVRFQQPGDNKVKSLRLIVGYFCFIQLCFRVFKTFNFVHICTAGAA